MKKQFLGLLLAGIIAGGISADEVLKITTKSSRWKIENGIYTLQKVEKGSDRLVISFTPAENTWYRLDYAMRYSDAAPTATVGVRVERNGKMGRFQFPSTTEWQDHSLYFSVKNPDPVKIDITLLQPKAGDFQIRNCKVTALKPEDFALNLIPGGEFETAESPHRFCMTTTGAKLVASNAFLNGKNALELEAPQEAKDLYQTVPLPIQAGKKYQLTFWVQSDSVKTLNVSLNCWSNWGHQGQHFYKQQSIKVAEECQEYTLPVEIPADFSASPDLRDGIRVSFRSAKGHSGKILLNDISFTEIQ